MLIKLNEGESVTVMLNHVDEPHAFTFSNRGGTLCGREFHRPAEQGELAATDSQHAQPAICPKCGRKGRFRGWFYRCSNPRCFTEWESGKQQAGAQ